MFHLPSTLLCPFLFLKKQEVRDLSEKQEGTIEISHIKRHIQLACLRYNGNYFVLCSLPGGPEKGHMKEIQKRATK
jgi:hypothetical protein